MSSRAGEVLGYSGQPFPGEEIRRATDERTVERVDTAAQHIWRTSDTQIDSSSQSPRSRREGSIVEPEDGPLAARRTCGKCTMTAPQTSLGPLVVFPDTVRPFRQDFLANGYILVPVRTGSKQPSCKDWQHGADTERLRNVTNEELNTGILAAGLRCLDVDVDDPQIAAAIKTKIWAFPRRHYSGARQLL